MPLRTHGDSLWISVVSVLNRLTAVRLVRAGHPAQTNLFFRFSLSSKNGCCPPPYTLEEWRQHSFKTFWIWIHGNRWVGSYPTGVLCIFQSVLMSILIDILLSARSFIFDDFENGFRFKTNYITLYGNSFSKHFLGLLEPLQLWSYQKQIKIKIDIIANSKTSLNR